jgi:YaiO family outer membrane protein
MRRALISSAVSLVLGMLCMAQTPPQPETSQVQTPQLPFRLELGGYGSHVTNGYGDWNGAQGLLWIRTNPVFIPAIFVDSQTRPQGTQQNYGFFSYLNWSKSFYTVQGFSAAPQRDPNTVYFPKRRYDIKANWKLPPSRNVVIGVGYTRFDLGAPGHGQIFNLGTLWYHHKVVSEANVFLNRNQPGDLYSASGSVAVQYGQEGKSWFGVSAGGGRQLYQYAGQIPFNVRINGYDFHTFYRKWISRYVGIIVMFDYQDLLSTYRRMGGQGGLFFEFGKQ